MKYTIHRCLTELKTLDSRINKKINNFVAIGTKKGSSNKVLQTHDTIESFEANIKSEYESIKKLIENRNKIKKAVVLSNANTLVTIAGVEYTVAEAIERKNSIELDKNLLYHLENKYNEAIQSVNKKNSIMEDNLFEQESKMRENGLSSKDIEISTELYRKQNGWDIINPLDIKSEIAKLDESISQFLTEVDHALSTSNALTIVDIDLD